MEALAAVSELAARLPFDMDDGEQREAQGALDDLSDEARFYGDERWDKPESAPYPVKQLVLKAAARHMKNPEGYAMSAAGDERVSWQDRKDPGTAGSATFTDEERKRLRELAGRFETKFWSVNMFHGSRGIKARRPSLVPDPLGHKGFPLPEPDW